MRLGSDRSATRERNENQAHSWLRAFRPTSDGAVDGQGMVEYALILVLVAVTAVVSITLLGGSIRDLAAQIDDVIIGALSGG